MISSNVSHLLRRLENWLLNQFNLKDDIDLSSNDQLPWILPRLLERASKKGNAIIVLDGLNHTQQSSLRWLPSKLPPKHSHHGRHPHAGDIDGPVTEARNI
mmetsp:Transcript_3762/g.6289  ORF Transcript_3762/g.6289 Transcript_3762/m.6289 type:complete len:101 (-) Transcript_3762:30-332(-)